MKFEVIDQVNFPLEDVYTCMRDKMTDLVPYLPDVKEIKCIEYENLGDGKVRIVNHWFAEDKIPGALKKFIKPEQLGWIDYAEWDDSRHAVKYRLEMMFFKEYIDVQGENVFSANGENSQIHLSGDLRLDLAKHPMIPRFVAKSITKQVEKLVLALIKPNLVKVNRGIEKHLAG